MFADGPVSADCGSGVAKHAAIAGGKSSWCTATASAAAATAAAAEEAVCARVSLLRASSAAMTLAAGMSLSAPRLATGRLLSAPAQQEGNPSQLASGRMCLAVTIL